MTDKLPVTVLIAAKNEEKNIGRCLASLGPAERVILIDSQSEDGTAKMAVDWGAEVVQFLYSGRYPKKRQWALNSIPIQTPWVFLLDADESVPRELWEEITAVIHRSDSAEAYLITKGFHFLGRRFRHGGFSHAAVLLFRRGKARFEKTVEEDPSGLDMEVHERLLVDGRTGRLQTPIIHEDFKGLTAYIARHNQYSTWEALARVRYLSTKRNEETRLAPRLFGGNQERRRFLKMLAIRTPLEPLLWFLYHYVFRMGFLEGKPGFMASRIRASYIAQARAKFYRLR